MSVSREPSPPRRRPWPLVALALGTAAALVDLRPAGPPRLAVPAFDAEAVRSASARFDTLTLPAPHASCHAASLAPRPGGGVLVAWFSGSREGAKDVEILFAEVSPQGSVERSWSGLDRTELSRLVGRSIRKLGNPSIAVLPNGTIHLFVTSVSVGGWSGSAVNLLASRDAGQPGTWAGRRLVLSPFLNFSTLVKAPPIMMVREDGAWAGWGLPAYHEFTTTEGRWVRLDDRFRTVDVAPMPQPVQAMQPAAVALGAERAVAALRDGSDEAGRVRWSVTSDGGRTWDEAPARDIANPNAAVALAALPDGSLLLAANPIERGRESLALRRSFDAGSTWEPVVTLATSRTGASEFSYPSLAVDGQGTVWLAYTEQRKVIRLSRFTLAWLDEVGGRRWPVTIDGILYGLAAQGVLIAAAASIVIAASGRRAGWVMRTASAAIAMALCVEPSSPVRPLAEGMRGIWGDPSVVTTVALLAWLLVPRLGPSRPRGAIALAGLALVAAFLYLPVFGVPGTANGLYRLGWGSTWLVVGVAAVGTAAWARGHGRWTTALALALAAWSIGLHESDNLWDSLVDPGLLGFVLVTGVIDRFTARPRPSPSAA